MQHALTCDYSNTATTQTDTVLAVATITEYVRLTLLMTCSEPINEFALNQILVLIVLTDSPVINQELVKLCISNLPT